MIMYLTRGMTRLALRIKEVGNTRQVTDWKMLQLLIQPGQYDQDKWCCFMGSPWILTGCWPGKRTNVDVANFRPDFPTIVYDAFDLDADGRIVFRLDEKLFCLPNGRYSGTVRVTPRAQVPLNLRPEVVLGKVDPGKDVIVPPEYLAGARGCFVEFPEPPCPPPPPRCCVLAEFDIDLGPECSEHVVDQVAVEYAVTLCGDENG